MSEIITLDPSPRNEADELVKEITEAMSRHASGVPAVMMIGILTSIAMDVHQNLAANVAMQQRLMAQRALETAKKINIQ